MKTYRLVNGETKAPIAVFEVQHDSQIDERVQILLELYGDCAGFKEAETVEVEEQSPLEVCFTPVYFDGHFKVLAAARNGGSCH